MRRGYSLERFHSITRWTLALLYIIVITGVTVRLTGSGLGCPDWPTCEGVRPVPAFEMHGMVEFTNRMVALPTSILVLWSLWAGWRLRERRNDIRLATTVTLGFVVSNIVLGGLTIITELDPRVVSAHFLLSMGSIASGTYAMVTSREQRVGAQFTGALGRWILFGAAALAVVGLGVIGAGVLTTAAGPHSGGSASQVIDRMAGGSLAVTLHARGAYLFAVLAIGLTLLARRSRAGARDMAVLTGLIVLQIILGEFQYRNGLPRGVVLAHVANAALIWITTCVIAFRAVLGEFDDTNTTLGADRAPGQQRFTNTEEAHEPALTR